MTLLTIVPLAALASWAGARWSRTLPAYEEQRRAIPSRTLVTLLLGTVTAAIAAAQGESAVSQALLAVWSVVFTLVTVVDIETHYIPNVLILPATALALLASLVDPRLDWKLSLAGAALGFALFLIIALVARGGFGMGDVKLAAFMGAVSGLFTIVYALLVGIFAGGIGAALLLAMGRVSRRSFIPYGPFLCLGGWLAMQPVVSRFWGF